MGKPFDILTDNGRIGRIFDRRYKFDLDVSNGKGSFGRYYYTLREDDTVNMKKPAFQPHFQYEYIPSFICRGNSVFEFENSEQGVSGKIIAEEECLHMNWKYENGIFSKFSASLPLNFMNTRNGEWVNQLLVSSPYFDKENGRLFCLFTRPDGNHLALISEKATVGFKIGYCNKSFGHFITDFEIVACNDKIYGSSPNDSAEISVRLVPVSSYREAMCMAAELWKVPAADYEISSGFIGDTIKIRVTGEHDRIIVITPGGQKITCYTDGDYELKLEDYGVYKVIPCRGNKRGIYCTCFAHCGWNKLHEMSVLSVPVERDKVYAISDDGIPLWIPPYACYRGYTDTNLCEHTMWAWSLLKFAANNTLNRDLEDSLQNLLRIITAKNIDTYRVAQTIVRNTQPEHNLDKYNTYCSVRTQEVFNGVNILLAYWNAYGREDLLELAVKILDAQLEQHFYEGRIENSNGEDYTTVTAMIFPLVDMYRALSKIGDKRAKHFAECAEKTADYILKRGTSFATEGEKNNEFAPETEEGSMACSALTLLYTARYIKYKSEYLLFAEDIMSSHDAWCVYTPNVNMFHSSLRWWETLWEGDADGPALCCGHAWTVWRAETEFWLGIMTCNDKRLLSSYNGYMSNFSKTDRNGNMYAIYQCEPYSNGAWSETAADVDKQCALGFPRKKDIGLSRYVFARAAETWFRCTALLKTEDGEYLLNGEMKDNRLVSRTVNFDLLYIGFLKEAMTVCTDMELEIFGCVPFEIVSGEISGKTEYSIYVAPNENGEILLVPTIQNQGEGL